MSHAQLFDCDGNHFSDAGREVTGCDWVDDGAGR